MYEDQFTPGHSIIDLRDVLEEVKRVKSIKPRDRDNYDNEYLGWVEDLEGQLWTNLEDYAENEPIAISEYYFEEYAQELATDLGFIDREHLYDWPGNCIDWKEAAEQLKCDYHEVTFGGTVYYVRSW